MQLVPLSTDGRATTNALPDAPAGPLRLALRPERDGIALDVIGPNRPRPVGRLSAADAAAYLPVLRPLTAQGRLGTCTGRVSTGGGGPRSLTLELAPPATCVVGNAPHDLVLLAAERTVTVTREEDHQDVLAGRTGRVAVALVPCAIAKGKHAGRVGLEVRLDGQRVGELTRLMSDRYLPVARAVAARGGRPGCEALLRHGNRGTQIELRLPAVDAAAARPVIAPPPGPIDVAGTRRHPIPPLLPPLPDASTMPVTRMRVPEPPPRRGRRPRRVLGVIGGVVGVLVLIGALDGGDPVATPGATASSAGQRPVASPTPSAAQVPAQVVSPTPAPVPVLATAPTPRSIPRSVTTSRARPAPTRDAKPAPAPRPAQAAPASDCHANYTGACVPIASDVDCEGGSGNGPAYVRGPVRVIGKDVYGLDSGGEPGVGCE
jgi:hypothetical protein